MLEELTIEGLGVIERASAQLHPGFTVLTGETGAGKTMIVTSLHLLSGARADAGRVRTGNAKATVEGRFRLGDADGRIADTELADLLASAGAELDDDGSVIAVRSVAADGRSRAHLGGRSVPVGLLGQATSRLLTIHGQNDQLRLLKPEHQRRALDTFAGAKAEKARRAYQVARDEWIALLDDLDVEEREMIDAEVDRVPDEVLRFSIVGGAVDARQRHAAETHGRNRQALRAEGAMGEFFH